ncbi:MAG: PEP-CTERM sorting domain-containing protein [Phycisphaeraceae bacterium]|nr:PEP-CTERM sorting domain-containing protein [Phycisphaeraceae bacterium]
MRAPASAQDWSLVPGVPIAYLEAPDRALGVPLPWDEAYIGSPSITIMPDGTYIASHDVFGLGTPQNTTWVYRSTNQGQSWSQLGSLSGQFWSTVFQHNGDLYIWGYSEEGDNGDIVIRKSTNNGTSWSSPVVLKDGNYGGTPNTPVINNNRIWFAQSGNRVMSAPVSSDLMDPASWKLSNSASDSGNPFGGAWQGWSEAQVVGSPSTGVVVMPKIRGLPNTALIQVNESTGNVSFDASAINAFPSLPGGEKKFGVQYDATSGKFFALTNVVLPAHANDPVLGDEPELIRNTGAMLSSKDLINWEVEKIFLYTRNIDTDESTGWGEAFQYFNYAIDGNDLAVVSRTALDVGDGENLPPRGHDSNLMTFHRIEDFRTATPKFVLVADAKANRVMRYEYANTKHLAPLGQFNLGATYAGAALDTPVGVAQTSDGDVFVTESKTGGRVLRFDAAGNFKEVIATSGTQFTGNPGMLTVGPDGNLYMSVAFGSSTDRIYKIDPDTNQVTLFITTDFAAGESFNNPRGMAFGDDGNFYVADRENDCIRKFNGSTGAYIGDIAVGQVKPQALAWDDVNDRLLFSRETSPGDTDIARINLPSSVLTLYTATDIGWCLGVVAVDGQLFWTDYDNGEIYASVSEADKTKTVSASNDLVGTAQIINATAPGRDNRTWQNSSSGDWADPLNWVYWGRPDTNDEIATFGSATSATTYVRIQAGETFTVKGMRFMNSQRYIIDEDGELFLEADTGHAIIDVQDGSQWIRVNTTLNDHLDVTFAAADDELSFRDELDLNGKYLYIDGEGKLSISGAFVMHGGRVVFDGLSTLAIYSASQGYITLDGDLQFIPDPSISLTLGSSFDLISAPNYFGGETFDNLYLPALSGGLAWNTSSLYTNGTISIVSNPEPASLALLATSGLMFLHRRRR